MNSKNIKFKKGEVPGAWRVIFEGRDIGEVRRVEDGWAFENCLVPRSTRESAAKLMVALRRSTP